MTGAASVSSDAPAEVTSDGAGRPPRVLVALIPLGATLLLAALYAIFVVAPVEQQMGIVQKIFYFHVPCAYSMYLGFVASAFGSGMYLAKREPRWDALGVAGAEVGCLFFLLVMITGPMWARKAWGVWWTWDPRLTTTLLGGMILTAYLVLRSMGRIGEVEKRFASGLALLGLLNLPVIHYSVQRWRGTHPTVITSKGGGLHPDMRPALLLGFALFTVISVLLVWLRLRTERMRQEIDSLELMAAERGLLEEV